MSPLTSPSAMHLKGTAWTGLQVSSPTSEQNRVKTHPVICYLNHLEHVFSFGGLRIAFRSVCIVGLEENDIFIFTHLELIFDIVFSYKC